MSLWYPFSLWSALLEVNCLFILPELWSHLNCSYVERIPTCKDIWMYEINKHWINLNVDSVWLSVNERQVTCSVFLVSQPSWDNHYPAIEASHKTSPTISLACLGLWPQTPGLIWLQLGLLWGFGPHLLSLFIGITIFSAASNLKIISS